MSEISIDYALSMAAGIGTQGGLTDAELDAETSAFETATARVRAAVDGGTLGFWRAPEDRELLTAIEGVIAGLPSVDDVLVLGIGGSSLGGRAIYQALTGPIEVPGFKPASGARLHFPDNSDPWLLRALMARLDPRRTLAVVISKSGGTVETAAQLVVVRDWLIKGGAAKHIVAITDPTKGSLRAFAEAEKLPTLPIPSNIGGRFSVLTAVGLLPARLAGVDCARMLEGAATMAKRCEAPELRKNPAGVIAAVHAMQHRLRERPIHILMPYADALRPFAAWFVQLWAESLGKRRDRAGRVVERGPTPLPAVGATDQHAQVQLFMEGPRDKLVTFISIAAPAGDLAIPPNEGDLAYLGGKSLGMLLDAELRGTALALARDGRPSLEIRLPGLDAASLGGLFFLFEAATAFAGELYDIDAFDQPGVEEGKRLAFGLLGRAGFESARVEVAESQAGRPTIYRV